MASSSSSKKLIPIVAASAAAGAVLAAAALIYRHHHKQRKNLVHITFDHAAAHDDTKQQGATISQRSTSTVDGIIHKEIAIDQDSASSAREENGGERRKRILSRGNITVAYCSTTGTCAGFAERLHRELQARPCGDATALSASRRVQLIRVSEVDWWDELMNNEEDEGDETDEANNNRNNGSAAWPPILLFVLPTWTDGTLPPHSEMLLTSLQDISTDWRVAPEPLRSTDPSSQLRVGAFGMGSSAYDGSTVGKPAKEVFATLVGKLGARPLVVKKCGVGSGRGGRKSKSLMIGDSEVGDAEIVFEKWMNGIVSSIFQSLDGNDGKDGVIKAKENNNVATNNKKQKEQQQQHCVDANEESDCACKSPDQGNQVNDDPVGCCSNNPQKSNAIDENSDSMMDFLYDANGEEDEYDSEANSIVDVEDMGHVMEKQSSAMKSNEPQEMVTPKQARALKKEGYKLIGTHSAVKLCRWTKHQLRGRGGCYKHTHYGITSYQCMEATPSLACANKCIFCWRHHKNPVGREWRWKTDDPKMIVEEAMRLHVNMIKETRGIPGIRMDRWMEAHRVRHCALSLVGEPIMYPRINELLGELHRREISTFLVTNGQHPQAIKSLIPITQLYVSVDASTPESLEAIDRPLFRDAWDRLKASLLCLRDKGQRTVARLTVVKGWNSDEIGGYARLISLGHCSLVEVKGVTFCGKSDASNLNMTNTPWHHEVVEFSKILLQELRSLREEGGDNFLPEYDLACEHKHSCSVLVARVDQFAVPDPVDPSKRKWRTWIDYEKFQKLAARHMADPTFKFAVEDYAVDTPTWAYFGADEEGFDPTDIRHRKKKKHPKYTKFDREGVPTHDTFDKPLALEEVSRLSDLMEKRKREMGDVTSVTELHGGEKLIDDASLMFRGLVVTR